MFNLRGEYIAEILPIRCKLPTNQPINQSINQAQDRKMFGNATGVRDLTTQRLFLIQSF